MSGLEIVFLVVALVTLYAALEVVTTNNLIHAALWLIVTLLGVATLYVLLNATFLAVVQVMVYIGAIAILMIFAIMLTRKIGEAAEDQTNQNWPVAAVFGFLMFAGLSVIVVFSGKNAIMQGAVDSGQIVTELGQVLVSPNAYILPFELASVLLLAALVGAIVVAWKK
ncbi:MAG TPA: NADH-quinone oxidoreductase subunit J [Anaerolineales bacterium]|nr:NADH-quinone oxidoreductase subunit J [Anaerolineales bacterium]